MKQPVINYAKEYLLLDGVLSALRFASMTLASVGSEQGGMIPVHEIALDAAYLHFGTLADFVNDPMKYRMMNWARMDLNRKVIVTKDINTSRYSLDDVSAAVETLISRGEVIKELIKDGTQLTDKVIKLTGNGLHTLNSKLYQKDYLFQRREDRTYTSTLWTNRMMIFFTGILAVSAGIESYKFFWHPLKHTNKPIETVIRIDSVATIDSTISISNPPKQFNYPGDTTNPYIIIDPDPIHYSDNPKSVAALAFLKRCFELIARTEYPGTLPYFITKLKNPKERIKLYTDLASYSEIGTYQEFRKKIDPYFDLK